jgi:parvulin-like peptidyl-prolyl isomerase
VIRILIVINVLGATALGGCKPESERIQGQQLHAPVVADVVARVGSNSIGASEVESRMVAEKVGAEAALEQLIDEALLVQEAERSKFTQSREDQRSIERLMVRAMLRDLEEENTPESISDEEVRATYVLHAKRFAIPERRRSWHILVEDQSEAAEALAKSILAELQRADDPRAVYDRYAKGGPESLTLNVKAEDLPAISKKASIKKSYKKALFAADAEGPLDEAVRTSYGWHAIVLAEILPEEVRAIDDAEGEVRTLLSEQERIAKLVTIVQDLEAQGLVHYDEQGVARLLSMPDLPERAE